MSRIHAVKLLLHQSPSVTLNRLLHGCSCVIHISALVQTCAHAHHRRPHMPEVVMKSCSSGFKSLKSAASFSFMKFVHLIAVLCVMTQVRWK